MQVMRLNRFITDNEKYQSGIGECNAGIKTVSFPSMAFIFLTLWWVLHILYKLEFFFL